MQILAQLGVNQTVWIQLGFFIVSLFFMSQFIFKPYKAILEYRKKNTKGAVEDAARISSESDNLVKEYQVRLQSQNLEMTSFYEQLKAEAKAHEEKYLSEARVRSSNLLTETRQKIHLDMTNARDRLRVQIPELSSLIASRVLGRELR